MDIKSQLKISDVLMDLWSRYRAKVFERRVGAERLYYEREARQKGLVYSEEEIPRLLEQRLSQRGLTRRLQRSLHVFAAIHHSNLMMLRHFVVPVEMEYYLDGLHLQVHSI